jgi:hypothetical protein
MATQDGPPGSEMTPRPLELIRRIVGAVEAVTAVPCPQTLGLGSVRIGDRELTVQAPGRRRPATQGATMIKEATAGTFVFRKDPGGAWQTALVWHPRLECWLPQRRAC